MVLVPEKAVEKLMRWNESVKRSDITYDRKSCFTWLLSLVGKEQLAASNVDLEVMKFITGITNCLIFFLNLTNIVLAKNTNFLLQNVLSSGVELKMIVLGPLKNTRRNYATLVG